MVGGQLDNSIGFIIQARMGSSRLPGKVLMPMPFGGNTTLLGKIINQLKAVTQNIVVASSEAKDNDAIEAHCSELGVKCYRGSEENVYSRFKAIQNNYKFRYIFRFTADNPFVDTNKMVEFLNKFLERNLDYAHSTGMPLGMNFEIMKGELFNNVEEEKLANDELEHVTLVFRRYPEIKFQKINIADMANLRMTVDLPVDYAQASLIWYSINKESMNLNYLNALKRKYQWLFELNAGVLQNATSYNSSDHLDIAMRFLKNKGFTKVYEMINSSRIDK